MNKMNSIEEERERYEQEVEDQACALFWIERLFLCLLLFFSELCLELIGLLLIFTTLVALRFFFLCPKLSSAGPSGISGFWLFLSDRLMFILALKSFEAENIFLWCLTVLIFIANHSVYIIEYLVRSYKPHNDDIPISELRVIDDETDDVENVSKEVEKIRELLKELREDEKKMDIEMEFMEHIINTDLETHRKNLSVKLLELREELRDDEEKMRTYMDLIIKFFVNVDETLDDVRLDEDKASGDEVKSVADEVYEMYFVIQEIAREAKTIADRANLTYLAAEAIIDEIQNMRCMIKEKHLEGFLELREEVRRMWLDFEARRMEAEGIAERAAEELSLATVVLVDAVEFRQWEEYKAD